MPACAVQEEAVWTGCSRQARFDSWKGLHLSVPPSTDLGGVEQRKVFLFGLVLKEVGEGNGG